MTPRRSPLTVVIPTTSCRWLWPSVNKRTPTMVDAASSIKCLSVEERGSTPSLFPRRFGCFAPSLCIDVLPAFVLVSQFYDICFSLYENEFSSSVLPARRTLSVCNSRLLSLRERCLLFFPLRQAYRPLGVIFGLAVLYILRFCSSWSGDPSGAHCYLSSHSF